MLAQAVFAPGGGSVGHRLDGLANHSLNIGAIFATAANTRALFPVAQLSNKGKTLSNLVYTTLFDQTMLTTPGGRAFVHKLAPGAGDEMIDSTCGCSRRPV